MSPSASTCTRIKQRYVLSTTSFQQEMAIKSKLESRLSKSEEASSGYTESSELLCKPITVGTFQTPTNIG